MRYEIAGKERTCLHCGSNDFDQEWGQLSASGLRILGLDFFHRKAWTFQCTKCGRVEWFAPIPTAEIVGFTSIPKIDKTPGSSGDPVECLTCGALIPREETSCSFCGWSYDD